MLAQKPTGGAEGADRHAGRAAADPAARPAGARARRPTVAAIIVSWNPGGDLAACVETLRSGVGGTVDEIVVVDNASTDDALARLGAPAGVTLVRAGANLGFGAGANLGARHCRSDLLLILNPDVRPLSGAIDAAAAHLAAEPRVAIAAALLVDAAGRWQPSHGHLGALGHLLLDTRWFRREPRRSRAVGWVHGAFMLMPRRVFDAVGGFDPRFFMYGEDMDLCARVRTAGFRTAVVSGARALHYGNQSGRLRFGERRAVEVLKGEMRFYAWRGGSLALASFRVVGAAKLALKAAGERLAGEPEAAARSWELARTCLGFRPEAAGPAGEAAAPSGTTGAVAGDRSAAPPACVTVAIPCRADEPGLAAVVDAVLANCGAAGFLERSRVELLVCVNGAGAPSDSPPVLALRERCAAHGIPLEEIRLDGGGAPVPVPPPARALGARLFLGSAEGKARAWNVLRAAAAGDPVFVCDADVVFSPGAFARLWTALSADPEAVVCSPKTDCRHDGSLLERIVAAPYRLDFPNLSGQLYAMRPRAAPRRMPEDLIEPERWLELAIGPERVRRDPGARVYVRLTTTLRDFFRQRVRIEMGKIQLRRMYPALLARSRPQPGVRAAARLPAGDRVRLLSYLSLRGAAHVWAWWRYRVGGIEGIWPQARTTKVWDADAR
jgi:hypothetical protein